MPSMYDEAKKWAGKVNVPGSKIKFANWDASREAVRKNRETNVHDDLRPEVSVRGNGIKVGGK